jgi:hypothetical protein
MFRVGFIGKRVAQRSLNGCRKGYHRICCRTVLAAEKHSSKLLFGFGVLLLFGGMSELAQAQNVAGAAGGAYAACGLLLEYMETGFGALVAAAAGVGAIIAAAVGGFKAAWSLLVVSIGAFILRAYITLFNAGCPGL